MQPGFRDLRPRSRRSLRLPGRPSIAGHRASHPRAPQPPAGGYLHTQPGKSYQDGPGVVGKGIVFAAQGLFTVHEDAGAPRAATRVAPTSGGALFCRGPLLADGCLGRENEKVLFRLQASSFHIRARTMNTDGSSSHFGVADIPVVRQPVNPLIQAGGQRLIIPRRR